MTDQYWIQRIDADGERYARVSDVIGFLLHIADRSGGDVADVLVETATSISVLLTMPDLEPRR